MANEATTPAAQAPQKKKKSKAPVILLIILLLIVALVVFIGVQRAKNVRAMREAIAAGKDAIAAHTTYSPRDPGGYRHIKLNALMQFDVEQYQIDDLGNLSVMTVDMGVMQMASFVLTPFEKNAPLLSVDYIYALTNRKAIVEFYDLVPDPSEESYAAIVAEMKTFADEYSALADDPADEAWYDKYITVKLHKKAGSADDATLKAMLADAVSVVMDGADTLDPLDADGHRMKVALTKAYSDGLITQGGVSTDVFKSALGEDTTRNFFDTVFFGTAYEQDEDDAVEE